MSEIKQAPVVIAEDLYGVFYTDGGYQRQYDMGGWGVHGYTFNKKESKTGAGMKSGMPTEKGYVTESKLPLSITPVEYVDALGTVPQDATNNVTELMGAIRAMEITLEQKLKGVLLMLDSQYVLNSLNKWAVNWEASNWIKSDGSPVANKLLVMRLLALKREILAAGITLETDWVKGHSGNIGNEKADLLATHSMISGINGTALNKAIIRSAKGYWKNKVDRNRMLNLPRMLSGVRFASRPDGEWAKYFMTKIQTADEFIGKRISDAQFGVVFLKAPDPVLEVLNDIHVQIASKSGDLGLVIYNWDEINKPDIYNTILQSEGDFLLIDNVKRAVRAVKSKTDNRDKKEEKVARPEDEEITEELDTPGGTVTLSRVLNPPRLAFRAMDSLDQMHDLLVNYLSLDKADGSSPKLVKYTDISPLLYGMVEIGKSKAQQKLLPSITSLSLSIDANVAYATEASEGLTDVKLAFGLDLPDRNTLSAVTGGVTKVCVVTWPESNHAVRYATIVETTDGVGIWAAPYANLHFVKLLSTT